MQCNPLTLGDFSLTFICKPDLHPSIAGDSSVHTPQSFSHSKPCVSKNLQMLFITNQAVSVVSKELQYKNSSLTSSSCMYRINTKSWEHDAPNADSSSCTANMGEDLIFAITCCLTSADISEICLLIVSLNKGTC